MATAFISKFNRQLVVSAAVHRQGSNHILAKGRFVTSVVGQIEPGQLKKFPSESNISRVVATTEVLQQQKRSFGNRYNEGQLLQKINYNQDIDYPLTPSTPSTVKGNVKNVGGSKGAAERGFNAAYADCIHRVIENVPSELAQWQTKVLTHNLSICNLGQRFGLLVPITYYQSMQLKTSATPTREQMTVAHALGWAVELIRAANTVTNDTIELTTNLENINRRADVLQPKTQHRQNITWATKTNIGTRAFHDALTLHQSADILIRHYCRDDPFLMTCLLDTTTEATRMTTLARSLELSWKEASSKATRLELPGGINMAYYDLNKYKRLIQAKYTFIHYCLPVSVALHLAGIHQPEVHVGARNILYQMGYFSEIYHDFSNCFVLPDGRDIHDGKLTWLIIVACQRANAKQRAILHECYGAGEDGPEADAKAAAVKKVYKELKLKKTLQTTIENTRSEIVQRVQSISKMDNLGLTPEFIFNLMEQMSLHDIS